MPATPVTLSTTHQVAQKCGAVLSPRGGYPPPHGPVAQRIERRTSNPCAEVRLLPGPLGKAVANGGLFVFRDRAIVPGGNESGKQILGETLDLFLTQEAAEAELREILEDEPEWANVLRVVPIELDERDTSTN